MKNSRWREYRAGYVVADQLRQIAKAREKLAEQLREIPIGKARPVETWKCHWCAVLNAIGAAVCDKCGMPRLE